MAFTLKTFTFHFGKADLLNRRITPSELVANDGEVAMIRVLHETEVAVGHSYLDGKIILMESERFRQQ